MAAKGQPKSGGRKAGTPNKVTADIKALAQSFGPQAVKVLIEIASEAEPVVHADCPNCGHKQEIPIPRQDQTRVAAVKELLDRGYGKARQPLTGEDDGSPIVVQVIGKPYSDPE